MAWRWKTCCVEGQVRIEVAHDGLYLGKGLELAQFVLLGLVCRRGLEEVLAEGLLLAGLLADGEVLGDEHILDVEVASEGHVELVRHLIIIILLGAHLPTAQADGSHWKIREYGFGLVICDA